MAGRAVPAGATLAATCVVVAVSLLAPLPATGQEALALPAHVPEVHTDRTLGALREQVHAALLAPDDDGRNTHLDAAESLGGYLTEERPGVADGWYWLAVAKGIRTEHGGPLTKLTTGREVFFTTARVLELDPDHAGGHELMGRLHAAVLRLPGLVRMMAMRMGLGDVLGEASWERAEHHYLRSAALDGAAIAPRLELARLYAEQERADEAHAAVRAALTIAPANAVDRRLRAEARALAVELERTR